MRKFLIILMAIVLSMGLFACGSADGVGSDGIAYKSSLEASIEGGETPAENLEQPTLPAGQLTAAEWCDLENYDLWKTLITKGQTENDDGIFYNYSVQTLYIGLSASNMFCVDVKNGEDAVAGAKVELVANEVIYTAVTNAKGRAYLFGSAQNATVKASIGNFSAEMAYTGENLIINLGGSQEKQKSIEIMFVVDTTGSMGDEIDYLKAELVDVIGRVKESNPEVSIKVALLFYRDTEDDYVTDYHDFSTDIQAQQQKLNEQSASGGGDFPEAVDSALSLAVSQQWTTGTSTKLIFHVLDAPPHETEQNIKLFESSVKTAAAKGIRIIPVASSGVDKVTEYLLRAEAMLTGGTYTFLTDDSGIGNEHAVPSVGEYTVELLNSMLVRLVTEFYTGTDIAPIEWRQDPAKAQ